MDEAMRDAERCWRSSGSAEDEAAYLRERLRTGDLSNVRLAALCGHEPAIAALAADAPPIATDLDMIASAASQIDPKGPSQGFAAVALEICMQRLAAHGVDVPIRTKRALLDVTAGGESARSEALAAVTQAIAESQRQDEAIGQTAQHVREVVDALERGSPESTLVLLRRAADWLSNPEALFPVVCATLVSQSLGRRFECLKRLKARYPHSTKTLDNSSFASDPGAVNLSLERLRSMGPLLRPTGPWTKLWRRLQGVPVLSDKVLEFWETNCREQLLHGDSRAAVVISVDPFVVSCYTDELDCVALLEFDGHLSTLINARVGQRLLTVNTYHYLSEGLARDLWQGERAGAQFGNFSPYVADLLSLDTNRLDARKGEIDEDEWRRCSVLGSKLFRAKQVPRLGTPWECKEPRGRLVLPVEDLRRLI